MPRLRNSFVLSEAEESSCGNTTREFLSEDEEEEENGRGASTSFTKYRDASMRSSDGEEDDDNNEYVQDSFVVSDSHESFLSTDSSIMVLDSPIVPRQQPARFAKHDLNTPPRRSLKPFKPQDSMERVKGKIYVNQKKKKLFDDIESPCKASTSSTSTVLRDVKDENQRRLLLELYPELADEVPTDDKENMDESDYPLNIEHVSQDISIISIRSEEDVSPKKPVNSSKKQTFTPKVARCDSDSEDDDAFDKYLKSLRSSESDDDEQNESLIDKDTDKFIVDDEEIIDLVSSDSGEEEEEVESDGDHLTDSDDDLPVPVKKPTSKLVSGLMADFNSPSLKKKTNDDDYFLSSLSPNYTGKRHAEAIVFVEKGIKKKPLREQLTAKLFTLFKRRCFDGEFPMDLSSVTWNARLRKTAGLCKSSVSKRTCEIELSSKVLTTADRLRDTLIHEMCHAANFIIDGLVKVGHGPQWKKWASQCVRRCPSLPAIERCHAYDIEAKYVYICEGCQQVVKRHSKTSFNTEKIVCGRCRGRFILQGADKQQEPKTLNKFALFVKENYNAYKRPGLVHKEVMATLSAEWKKQTASSSTSITKTTSIELDLDHDMSIMSIHD